MAGRRDKDSDAFMVVGDALENQKVKSGNLPDPEQYQEMLDNSKVRAYQNSSVKSNRSSSAGSAKLSSQSVATTRSKSVPTEKLTFREIPPADYVPSDGQTNSRSQKNTAVKKTPQRTQQPSGTTQKRAQQPGGTAQKRTQQPSGTTQKRTQQPSGTTQNRTQQTNGTAQKKTQQTSGTAQKRAQQPSGAAQQRTRQPSGTTQKSAAQRQTQQKSVSENRTRAAAQQTSGTVKKTAQPKTGSQTSARRTVKGHSQQNRVPLQEQHSRQQAAKAQTSSGRSVSADSKPEQNIINRTSAEQMKASQQIQQNPQRRTVRQNAADQHKTDSQSRTEVRQSAVTGRISSADGSKAAKNETTAVNYDSHAVSVSAKADMKQTGTVSQARPISKPAGKVQPKTGTGTRTAVNSNNKKTKAKPASVKGFAQNVAAAAQSFWLSVVALHKSMSGMTLKERVMYLLSLIGPTYRSIAGDPEKRATAYKVIIVSLSLLLAIHMTSVTNDIMGFTRSDKEKVVTVESEETTNSLIGKLDREGLIKHSTACKLFITLTSSINDIKDAKYLKGDFTLSADMGIEKMLVTCMATQKSETVSVTIPEGYTVEQIAEKLEDSKVCSKSDFLKAANSASYDYDFIEDISNADSRYHLLEGYMYPDTYEFYIGESASSVVSRLLNNFSKKWTDSYAERAAEINMSLDDVLTMASIIQKEDSNADNMKVIASVFYNRLNSSAYPSLQSDATTYYLENYVKPNVTDSEYETYTSLYSTYDCQGLPAGPICSPGDDAISAVLWPESTNYYFFVHDDEGNLYAARTASEQNLNAYVAAQSTTDSSDSSGSEKAASDDDD